MNNNLGKLIILLLTLSLSILSAEDFSYSIGVDNPTPYQKEGIIFTLELNQTNPDIVLFFSFDIKKSDNYSFTRLDSVEVDTHHNAYVKYLYLIYPLKSGELEIEFNLTKKVTNDESITFSYSGDRDNVKGLVTQDSKIMLPPLLLKVKEIPKGTLLVGDFKLSHTITKHQADAYEPIPFNLTIKGEGYPPLLKEILPQKGDFRRFKEKPIVHSKATTKGTRSTVVYPLALSHHQSFHLEPITIKAFNPKTKKPYTLSIPKQKFEISPVAIEHLIDKKDTPKIKSQGWNWSKIGSWVIEMLSYIIIFVMGYFTAIEIEKVRAKRKKSPTTSFALKIKASFDEKALLQLLIASGKREYAPLIERLEGAIYQGKRINFKHIKQEIIKTLE